VIASVHDFAEPETVRTYYLDSGAYTWTATVPVAPQPRPCAPMVSREISAGELRERLTAKRAISRKGLNLNPAMAPKQLGCSPRRGWNLPDFVVPTARARSCC